MKLTQLITAASLSILTAGAVTVDLTTPKEAAKSVYRTLEAGDSAALQQTLDVSDPVRQPMVAAMADLLVITKRLSDTARAKFGADAERLASGSIITDDLKLLDEATVSETDGTATITIANQLAPLVLKKREGGWKLDISDYFAAHDDPAAQTKLLQHFSAELKAVADDINANKFSTATSVETAIQQRFNEVMIKSVKPTTAPTSAPAQ